MRRLPGYEWGPFNQTQALASKGRAASESRPKTIGEKWQRIKDTKATSIFLDKPAMDWYSEFELDREFTQRGQMNRHKNAVDAFRHAYSAGMTYAHYGETVVDVATELSEDNSEDSQMDRRNNAKGVSLYKELRQKLGREPSESEFAEFVVRAVLRGELRIDRDNGAKGWQERVRELLDKRAEARMERIWEERREHPERAGEALAPKEFDRGYESPGGFDRDESRPGFGDDGSMLA